MTSVIERIDTDLKVPFNEKALMSKDPAVRTEAHFELVKFLQELLEKLVSAANLIINMVDGDAIYSKPVGTDGKYPIGTWRLKQVGDVWQRQYQSAIDTWTEAGDFEIPII